MADNNQQVEKPGLEPQALKAQDEFAVILDVLKVPLRADVSNQKLPPHRGWRGGCLLELKYPDLVPVPDEESGGFCRLNDAGQLVVNVENRGNVDAPECVTEVTFTGVEEPSSLHTPALQAGEARELEPPLKIPEVCFEFGGGISCEFEIRVDANDEVVEANKENNTASGRCSRGEP
jgi:hypothetical protein